LAVKVPPALLRRIEALARPLSQRPDLCGFGATTKSLVVKLALVRGLEALERELGVKGGK
jgi:hypothetical protein